MRKLFTSLKAVVAAALIASMTLAASCSYDDSAINNRVNKVEEAIKALEARVKALEDHATAVDKLIDDLVVVTDVTVDGDKTTVTLSDGTSFVVYGACDTLQYREVNGVLEISADGETWVAVQSSSDCVITSVVVNDDNTVTFTLANGEEFTVALAELIECEAAREAVYVIADTTKEIPFTINDAVVDINVMNQPFGWSATVAEAEDNNGGAVPMAAGGTDYVLQINAPSTALINAGFAAKEGEVLVHFNTAAGACKVLKVKVTLAELTLKVENGVITLSNSVAYEQSNRFGETFTDFADFTIGVMEASAYEQYGNNVFVETFDDWDYEYTANVNHTKRTSGFQNRVDLMLYEEGTCEQEVYTFTVEELALMFYPNYEFELGGEYIIFVTMDTELVGYVEHPVLSTAIMVDYKNVSMVANYVSSTFNGAEYEFNLAGYSHFIIGWAMKQEVDMYIEYGVCSSLADYLALSAADMGGVVGLPGTLVAGPVVGTYNLADLRTQSMTGYAPDIYAETEYYFYVYPVNIESEMDLYSPVDKANVYEFGTFETTGYVAGNFDAGVQYEVVELEANFISVVASFNENVTSYAYSWFYEEALDVEARISYMLEYCNFYSTEYGPCEAYDYPETYPVYLGIVAVNANGEYVFLQEKFEYVEPVLPVVEITSFEYVARAYELDDDPSTAGGDYVYDFTCADGTSYRMGVYYAYVNAEDNSIKEGTYNYCTNNLNWMYGGWDGFAIVSDTYYHNSTLTVTADTITWKVPNEVAYVYTKGNAGGQDPVEPEEPAIVELVSASAAPAASNFIGGTGYDVTFLDADGNAIVFQVQTKGNAYLREGSWNDQEYNWSDVGYINNVVWPGVSTPWPYEMIVEVVDGAYNINLAVMDWDAEGQPVYEAHYAGQIEGMTLPVEEEEVETELPNCENLTLYLSTAESYTSIGMGGYGDIRLVDADGKNYINIEINDQPVVTCSYVHSGDPTGISMASGTIYESNTYVSYSGPAPLTTETPKVNGGTMDVVVDGDNCTITINFTLQDGNTFTGTYTGVKPF